MVVVVAAAVVVAMTVVVLASAASREAMQLKGFQSVIGLCIPDMHKPVSLLNPYEKGNICRNALPDLACCSCQVFGMEVQCLTLYHKVISL